MSGKIWLKTRPDKNLKMPSGVWEFEKEGGKYMLAYHSEIDNTPGFRIMYLLDEEGLVKDEVNGWARALQISQREVDLGKDITEEYLADAAGAFVFINQTPLWFNMVLKDRPDINISEGLIKELIGSSNKELRMLGIKLAARMKSRKIEAGAKIG